MPPDVFGNAYEYLIKKFADQSNKKAGEYYTCMRSWRFFAWHQAPAEERPPLVPRAACLPTFLVWAEVYDQQ